MKTKQSINNIWNKHLQNTTKEERLEVLEEIEKAFEQLKVETNYVYQNGTGIQKDFTVGELKKYLNRVPDDYIVCKTLIDGDSVEYSSVEVLTVMQKQNYIDFKGDDKDGNIITIY